MSNILKAIHKIKSDANCTVINEDVNKIIWHDDNPTNITNSQIQAQLSAVEIDMAMKDLRTKRDQLLAKSDWRVIAAKEKGTTLSAGFKAYRQALRDLPSTVTDDMTAEDINNITFPTE